MLFKKEALPPLAVMPSGESVPLGTAADPGSADPAASKNDSPAAFRVTYMGQPMADSSADAPGSLTSQTGIPVADSIQGLSVAVARQADSLMALVLSDSLAQLRALVPLLQESMRLPSAVRSSNQWDSSFPVEQMYRTIPSILPVRLKNLAEYRVSSAYGQRVHPITGKLRTHAGIDLPQPRLTPVYATADGVVDRVLWEPDGLGLAVFIAHPSGYQTGYGHLEDHAVLVGQPVRRGDVIGRVGSTGLSTGPHLHYTVLAGSVPVDPAGYCFLLINVINQRQKMLMKAAVRVDKKKAP